MECRNEPFACLVCGRADRFTLTRSQEHVECSRCRSVYSVKDISQGVPLWVPKTGHAMPIGAMNGGHLNNAIAMLLIKPESRPGALELLLNELEKRQRRLDN